MTIAELRAAVRAALTRMEEAHRAYTDLPDDSTDEQRTERREAFEGAEREHREATSRLSQAEAVERARDNAPPEDRSGSDDDNDDNNDDVDRVDRARGGGDDARPRDPATYGPHAPQRSYFLDLARANVQGDADARGRLERHAGEIREELERRGRRRQEQFDAGMEQLLRELPAPLARELQARGLVGAQQRDLTRVDGAGGDFVPPLYLIDEYAEAARAGRPFVNACRQIPLPGGTDSINVPKISTGTATGVQTADNAAVQETDMVTATVTAPARTIAGQQDVPLQLLEQSPIAFDEVVFADLVADYYFRTEVQALQGSGSSGQVRGILNVSGINGVTYTDASPTVPELYPKIADALNQARTARKRPIRNGWLAPRRYYWACAQLDSQNRPLVVPQVQGPNNALGVPGGQPGGGSGEDLPLFMLSLHQMTDGIPVDLGAGTNEDRIIETRNEDHLFFEGDLRARVLPEVLSGTLQVRLQVYAYVAFTAERFPAATSVISGTGLATPTF